MDMIEQLLGHDHWANETLLTIAAGLTDEQLDQQFDIGLKSVRVSFFHLIYNTEFWLALMQGKPEPELDRTLTFPQVIDWYRRVQGEFAAEARAIRDAGKLDATFIDHYEVAKSNGGTIIHVVMHNLEHRTEILHMFVRLGLEEIPEIDFGLWDYLVVNNELNKS